MSTEPSTAAAPVLLTEVTDGIGVITLNRPARRNALNGELIAALDAAVRQLVADARARVVILTGAPAPGHHGGFCSGGDVKEGAAGTGDGVGVPRSPLGGDLSRHDLHAAMLLHLAPKPTIAMIGGPAIGAGCSLAAACDLRFASDDAVMATNFSPNGLAGDYGGSFFWTRIVGTGVARQLYLLNERIPAARALALGMVHAVVPPAELRTYTLHVARRLAKTPPELLALVKDDLNQAEDEVERRRWLFANEAANQLASAGLARERRRGSAPAQPSD